ncbi:hypothetical protein VE01_00939 [Pseudogymnoascus verrucosus]|uniref:Myb-like domain-containing protein n=1 Tax=Pseudogymnoascus verrucosus TaxID=342668 RepID=A0A2P2SW20_9PEZI|nr:uncharacterized protein VE01_00939 [Pseudogymnoascus verrucosus]OBU01027.1 hypothetical protein VE01_00939 [Pseudogymnoascus verrucosus]
MSKRPAAPVVDQKKVVVIEYDKLEGTYLELGFWDDDIGAEKYAELLHKGRIREEAIVDFDGNLLRIHGQPNTAIALKNETIFRCLCTPDLQNCRACFMRKRTIYAEGRAQLARLERRSAKAAARHYKAKAGVLEAEVAVLTSSLGERDTEVATLKSSLAERDAELDAAKAQVLALKDFIANRFTDAVQSLGAAHPVAEFQQAADAFEKEGGNMGRSALAGAFGLPAERAPTSDTGVAGGGVLSGSPGSGGDITDSDDEDVHDGLARKRRRISSAGPSRPPTSTAGNNSRRRPSSSLGARRKHSVPSSSLPALAVPASSGPEQPPIRRRKLPATAASAHAVSASSVPEAQKPAGRSSWNSRSAQLDFDDAVVPMASIAAAVAEENAVLAASGSGKRRADSTLADNEVGLEDSQELRSASPAADTDNDSDADVDTDSDSDTISGSGSGSDSDGAAAAAAPAPAPAPAARRSTSWSEHEKNCLIAVMFAHADAVKAGRHPAVYDTALWAVVRRRLMAEYGIDRVPQACRMMWNRGLRELTGLDERLRRDPNRMATSLQKKAGQ